MAEAPTRAGAGPMAEPFTHRLRVRYAECDLQGVLFNANYLAYIDHTITELWRAAYGGYTVMLDRGVDIVVAEVQPALPGLGALRRGGRHRGDGDPPRHHQRDHRLSLSPRRRQELLLEAEIRHVFVDPATAAKTPIPDWARATGLAPLRDLAATGSSSSSLRAPAASWARSPMQVSERAARSVAVDRGRRPRHHRRPGAPGRPRPCRCWPRRCPGVGGGSSSILAQMLREDRAADPGGDDRADDRERLVEEPQQDHLAEP